MNPADAAMATRELIKPRMTAPMHYGITPQLSGTPDDYIKALGATPVKVLVVEPGYTLDL